MKKENYRNLVIFCVGLFGLAMAFFVALAVLEQLEIHPVIDLIVSGVVGIGVASFIFAMIGIHRWIEGHAIIKIVMLIAGICLSSLTIFGVYSGMQSSWFRNITKSDAHQRMTHQADVLSNLASEQSNRGRITKADKTAQELIATNKELNEMERTGSHNAENQWAQGLASTFGGEADAWAFGRHTAIGTGIDIAYYLSVWFFCYGLALYPATTSHKRKEEPIIITEPSKARQKERPLPPTPQPRTIPEMAIDKKVPIGFHGPEVDVPPTHTQKKNPVELGGATSSNGNNYKDMQGKSLQKQLETKEKRKEVLRNYIASQSPRKPSLAEMASAIGVSSQGTVRKYLEEMGY